jgi:hypothetical protein
MDRSPWTIAPASTLPGLTPCDFGLWGMLKQRMYSRAVRDISDLKDRVRTVYHLFPAKCVSVLQLVLLLAGFCVLNATANRLTPNRKSSDTYDVCFVNKWFLQFKC